MRHLTVVGFAGLTAWTIVSATGLALGVFRISPHATLRSLLAVLMILVSARRTYREVQEWHWQHLPPD
jgi:small-conductance mechanosensitive channel